MSGVSHMLVFVVAGVLTAVSFLWGYYTSFSSRHNSFAAMHHRRQWALIVQFFLPIAGLLVASCSGSWFCCRHFRVFSNTGMIDAGGGVGLASWVVSLVAFPCWICHRSVKLLAGLPKNLDGPKGNRRPAFHHCWPGYGHFWSYGSNNTGMMNWSVCFWSSSGLA